MKKFRMFLLVLGVIFIIYSFIQINELTELAKEREQMKADLDIINNRLESLNNQLEEEKAKVVDLSKYPNIEWVYQNKEFLNENVGD